ncbi:MAG: helix-turn-helix transcriptional regulator [Burkholderiales bacterium]|nr:helix-turn-helix transcriptional regulator [Burkholderiales bacterium]
MPQTWTVSSPPAGHSLPASAVSMLLAAPHDAAPAARMLAFLNAVAPVAYLSLVEYTADTQPGTRHAVVPRLAEGHARRPNGRNVTAECFAIYRRQYYQRDEATRIGAHLHRVRAATASVTALHFGLRDIPLAAWRNEIYEREHLADRLSFLYAPLPGTAWAINLYRDDALGAFAPAELEKLLAVAPLLRQVHQNVLRAVPPAFGPVYASNQASSPVKRSLFAIQQIAPELSGRELAVCARIACGMSADGIAAELGVAPSTVVTLRKRAYTKLAAHGVYGGRLQLARLAAAAG